MSKELNVLLQRIQKPETMKPLEKPVQASPWLSNLLDRMDNRKWKKAELIRTLHNLQVLQQEIEFIKHVRKCRRCQAELQISVERYCGSRGPWYLNLMDEQEFPEIYEEGIYKTCPKPQNYKIGSYWSKLPTSNDTIRFIMDRMAWAEKLIKADAQALVDYYVAFEAWDLESPPPIVETNLIY